MILAIGSNTTETHPIISLEVRKALTRGAKMAVIDPRRTEMAELADWHLPLRPGTNIALLNAIAKVIIDEQLYDRKFVEENTEGFEELRKGIASYAPAYAEEITGVPADLIIKTARAYAKAERATILYCMGVTQHNTGTANVMAVANLAMLCGHVGKPGTGVNPLRGQNNVQGACDMGGLPDVYTAYQKVSDPEARSRFSKAWKRNLPAEPGLTLGEIMEAASEGRIKGMYIMGENPVLSDPDSHHVEAALKNLDFLVVQDIFLTETARLADVVLPATTFAEKEGTFTNTERRVQMVRQAIKPVGNSRPDWWIIAEIGRRLGVDMEYDKPEQIFDEMRMLTPSYRGMTYARLNEHGLQWPCPSEDHPGTPILHVDGFIRGKGRFAVVEQIEPAETADEEYPLLLSTGRRLVHYHTGTMSRRSPALDMLMPSDFLEMNPEDARRLGIRDGDDVRVTSRRGEVIIKARVTDTIRPGTVFASFHFWEQAINRLTHTASDPVSKVPQLKVSAVRVDKVG